MTTDSIPPVTFSVSLSLLLLLSKKAKVLPQLDFSATIKAKRRAVERDDGERENDAEESTQALFSCSSIYQFVTYRNTCHADKADQSGNLLHLLKHRIVKISLNYLKSRLLRYFILYVLLSTMSDAREGAT